LRWKKYIVLSIGIDIALLKVQERPFWKRRKKLREDTKEPKLMMVGAYRVFLFSASGRCSYKRNTHAFTQVLKAKILETKKNAVFWDLTPSSCILKLIHQTDWWKERGRTKVHYIGTLRRNSDVMTLMTRQSDVLRMTTRINSSDLWQPDVSEGYTASIFRFELENKVRNYKTCGKISLSYRSQGVHNRSILSNNGYRFKVTTGKFSSISCFGINRNMIKRLETRNNCAGESRRQKIVLFFASFIFWYLTWLLWQWMKPLLLIIIIRPHT
jgi:hypothetical protein